MNKKGGFVEDHLGAIVIAVLVLLVLAGIAYIWGEKIIDYVPQLFNFR